MGLPVWESGFTQPVPPPMPPTILSVAAPLVDPDGMIPILLTGTNLLGATSVIIGVTPATAIGVDRASSTEVSALTPALAPGFYDVTVVTPAGSFTLSNAIEYWDADQVVAPAVAHVYDSEEGITTVAGDVTVWNDQGAGAANLAGVAPTAPQYAVARFGDGLRHGLLFDETLNPVLVLAAGLPLAFAKRSIFCAFKWSLIGAGVTSEIVTGTSGSIIDFALDATGGLTTMRTIDANIPANRRSPDDPELPSGAVIGSSGGGSAKLLGEIYDGVAGSILFFQNNTQDGPVVATTAVGANWLRIGTGVGNPCGGELGAIVIVEDEITVADRLKLTTWMWGKWIARSTIFSRVNNNTPWFARDGAALLALGSDIYMLGGWNSQGGGQFPAGKKTTNEIWKSSDLGVTWALLKANDYTPAPPDSFWTPRHTMGAVVHTDGGPYLYVIGSDVYNGPQNNVGTGLGTSDVWRSADGFTWTRLTDTAPWGPRVLHMVASLNGKLYVMGGLTNGLDPTSAVNDVWESSDGGVTWVQLANAPWAPRGLVNSGQGLPIVNGKIMLCGGGTYSNVPAGALYNDVWSFDGAVWALVNPAAPWVPRQYNATFVFEKRLWVVNGVSDFIGTNISDCWSSDNGGATWIQQTITPWRASHADGVTPIADRVIVGPGNGQIGQPVDPGTGKVFAITRAGFVHP